MNASDGDGNGNHPFQNYASENEQKKKGKGRQKITMAKIENETSLQVTFSKRRAGVFKKASELSTLCGAETAVVVFSPGNNPHAFGHPDVETVANRFLHAASDAPARATPTAADQLITAHNEAAMQQSNQKIAGIEAELGREKQRKKQLDSLSSGGHAPPKLDELGYEELEQLRKSVLGFKREFEAKVKSGDRQVINNGDGGGGASANLAVDSISGGFPATYDYGYGYGYGGSSNLNNNNDDDGANYGYTVQYPALGMGGSAYNYGGDPSAVVPYDAGTGNSDADGGRDADDVNNYRGFGTNYGRPHF